MVSRPEQAARTGFENDKKCLAVKKVNLGLIARMTTKQLNKLTTALAVEGIIDPNIALFIASIPAFASSYADLQSHVTNIQTLWQAQAQKPAALPRTNGRRA